MPILPNGARQPPMRWTGDPDAIARSEADRLETEFDTTRLKALIAADGWASPRA